MNSSFTQVWPEAWIKLCNNEEEQYHGGTINDNNCLTLLNNTKLMRDPQHLKHLEKWSKVLQDDLLHV